MSLPGRSSCSRRLLVVLPAMAEVPPHRPPSVLSVCLRLLHPLALLSPHRLAPPVLLPVPPRAMTKNHFPAAESPPGSRRVSLSSRRTLGVVLLLVGTSFGRTRRGRRMRR